MSLSPRRRRRHFSAALLLSAAIPLTACGQQRIAADAPSASTTASTDASPGAGPSAPAATPSGATPSSPYVEPGAHDGAPHYNENNAGRQPRDMSPASERDAQREAHRIDPVLKRLWTQRKWDPKTVRSAMLALGYKEQRTDATGKRLDAYLEVREMERRFETDHYVTPEGAQIGLYIHKDACVTAFVQKTNYQVQVNGPYMETGCFAPPFAH
ncbi:hypothetical protein [Streptomyces sp. NPDC048516]|uniref:hypothetical protein n=1 Tax=Streptomyces sp. NPDC048516 TaxID=3365565 RepID=UPI00371611D3